MKNLFVILALACACSNLSAENLLVNPGGEPGNMSDWVVSPSGIVSAVTIVDEATGDVEPYAGNFFFRFNRGSFGTMYQDIDLGWEEPNYLYAGGMMNNELWPDGIDTGELVITFFDIDEQTIESYTTGETAYTFRGDAVAGAEGYGKFGLAVPVPDGTAKVRYQINGYLYGGSFINTFVDDLFMELIPDLSDFDKSDFIDLVDFALFAGQWQTGQGQMNWEPEYDISQPPNGIVDIADLSEFVIMWLNEI